MKYKLGLLLLMVALFAGCSNLGIKKSDEEIVAERVQEWADALVNKDFKKAWSYTTPGFRKANNVDVFKRGYAGALNWTAARFKSAVCEQERCQVTFEIDYYFPKLKMKNTRALERVWIKVDGKWWLYVK